MNKQFLKEYLNTNSPSGKEQEAQDLWVKEVETILNSKDFKFIINHIKSYKPESQFANAYFEISSNIDFNHSPKKTIVIASHVDEISWRITNIEPSGLCRITRNGGTDETTALGSLVDLYKPLKGHSRTGVIGQKAIHLRDHKNGGNATKIEDLFIDFGFKNIEEAKEVVTVGDLVIYKPNYTELSDDIITSKAIDNKIGGFILTEVLKGLKELLLDRDIKIILVNTVQEETGLRGAKLFCNENSDLFDYAIVTDVCHATDTPGISKSKAGDIKLGSGSVTARGSLLDDALVKMSNQNQVLFCRNSTGTDADQFALCGEGKSVALIKTPLRYMHTQTEVVSLSDVKNVTEDIINLVDKISE